MNYDSFVYFINSFVIVPGDVAEKGPFESINVSIPYKKCYFNMVDTKQLFYKYILDM